MTTTGTAWSRYTGWCQSCRRRFRIENTVMEVHRGPGDMSDIEIAQSLEYCAKCAGGVDLPGEYINDNPEALRWDPKGWALVTLERMARATRALERAIAERTLFPATQCRIVRRLVRCAFLGEALRARIDGRY